MINTLLFFFYKSGNSKQCELNLILNFWELWELNFKGHRKCFIVVIKDPLTSEISIELKMTK